MNYDLLRPYLLRIIKVWAENSKSTIQETEEYLLKSSSVLRNINSNISTRVQEYFDSLAKEGFKDIRPFSHEIHFENTIVAKAFSKKENCDSVVYSAKRSNSDVYYKLITYYTDLLKIELYPRNPSHHISNSVLTREFVPDKPIQDYKKASFHAGCLVAFCQSISMTDLHAQNIVFIQETPVIIDDECIFQPIRENQIRNLEMSRKQYYLSVYRSLLVFDPYVPKSLAKGFGLQKLYQGGISLGNFLDGYSLGISTLKKNKQNFFELFQSLLTKDSWFRYLVRSSGFYEYCIEYYLTTLIGNDASQSKKLLSTLFQHENNLFPELQSFIDNEIACIQNICVPYYLVNAETGYVNDKKSPINALGKIKSPLLYGSSTFNSIINSQEPLQIEQLEQSVRSFKGAAKFKY